METRDQIKFGEYQALQKMLNQPNFDPSKIDNLKFSSQNYLDTPPGRALKLFPNLKIIDFSHNRISSFNTANLLKGAPLLEVLNLSYNNITTLDDLIELGSLKHLKKLTFVENPIAKKLIRVKVIEFLLFPAKYKPYDGVKILTAGYENVVDKSRIVDKKDEELAKFARALGGNTNGTEKVNNHKQKESIIHLSMKQCPVPRKTRFPMLEILNGDMISILDIRSILMADDISHIFPKIDEGNMATEEDKLKREDERLHQKYIAKYIKRQTRKEEAAGRGTMTTGHVETGEDELMALYQKGQAERLKMKMGSVFDNLWQQPIDLQYRNTEYNVTIENHKKMLQDFENYKAKLKEDKKRRKMIYVQKIRAQSTKHKKNKKKDTFGTQDDESIHSIDSDQELVRLFALKPRRKAKYNLEVGIDCSPMDSDDSSVEENEDELKRRVVDSDVFNAEKQARSEEPSRPNSAAKGILGSSKKDKIKAAEVRDIMANIQVGDDDIEIPFDRRDLDDSIRGTPMLFRRDGEKSVKRIDFAKPTFDIKEKKVLVITQNQAQKLPKTIFVTCENGPNLSLPIFQRKSFKKIKSASMMDPSVDKTSQIDVDDREDHKLAELDEGFKPEEQDQTEVQEAAKAEDDATPDENTGQESDTLTFEQQVTQNENDIKLTGFHQSKLNPQSPGRLFSSPMEEKVFLSTDPTASHRLTASPDEMGFAYRINQPEKSDFLIYPEEMGEIEDEEDYKTPTKTSNASPDSRVDSFRDTAMSPAKSTGDLVANKKVPNYMKPTSSMNRVGRLQLNEKIERPVTSMANVKLDSNSTHRGPMSVGGTHGSSGHFDFPAYGLSHRATAKQAVIMQSTRNHSQNGRNAFKISNKIFFRHNEPTQPKTTFTTPKKANTHRGTQRTDVTTRSGSVQWTQWTPANATPQDSYFKIPLNNLQSSTAKASQASMPLIQSAKKPASPEPRIMDLKQSQMKKHEPEIGQIKAGGMSRKQSAKIIVKEPIVLTQSLPEEKRAKIEDLIPNEQDGVSEKMKWMLLGNKEERAKLKETARMLDETALLIQQSEEIASKVHVNFDLNRRGSPVLNNTALDCLKREMSLPDKTISYDQITEFMRQKMKLKQLSFKNNEDLRELIYLSNDFTHHGEMKLSKLQVEQTLRELREKASHLDGGELEETALKIAKLSRYLEILENIEANKRINSKQLERIEMREIAHAENTAILAAHYTKLKKYYGEAHINKYSKGYEEVLENVESNKVQGMSLNFAHKMRPTTNMHDKEYYFSLAQTANTKKVENEKDTSNMTEAELIAEEKEPRWLKHTRVENYNPKPMLTFEQLTEIAMIKKHEEMSKAGQRILSVEEQMMKYVEDLKSNAKNRKELKAKIEKHIRSGRKDIDEFLETYRLENPKIHDKQVCFREYVQLIWENKV